MKRIGATVAITWLAVASAGASAPGQAVDAPVVQVEQVERVHWGYPVVRIGQSYTLKAGETVREVTVIFGDAYIDGHVDRDVAVVLGSAHLASTAVVGGSLVVVGGSVQASEGAQGHEDLFVGGGGLDGPVGFSPGGHSIGDGSPALDEPVPT